MVDAFQIAQLPQPVVSITSPSDGATETSTPVKVTGTVSDTVDVAKVTVNGVQAKLGSGTWKVNVPLTSGRNTITATATDGAGVSGSASISVSFSG